MFALIHHLQEGLIGWGDRTGRQGEVTGGVTRWSDRRSGLTGGGHQGEVTGGDDKMGQTGWGDKMG